MVAGIFCTENSLHSIDNACERHNSISNFLSADIISRKVLPERCLELISAQSRRPLQRMRLLRRILIRSPQLDRLIRLTCRKKKIERLATYRTSRRIGNHTTKRIHTRDKEGSNEK